MAGEQRPHSNDEITAFFDAHETDFSEAFDPIAIGLGYAPFAAAEGTQLDRNDATAEDRSKMSLSDHVRDEQSTEGDIDVAAGAMAWLALRQRVEARLMRQHNADSLDKALLQHRLIPVEGDPEARSRVVALFRFNRGLLALNDDEYLAIDASMNELGE